MKLNGFRLVIINVSVVILITSLSSYGQDSNNTFPENTEKINQIFELDQKYRLMIMYGETNSAKLDSLLELPLNRRMKIIGNRNTDKYTLSDQVVDSLWQKQNAIDSSNFEQLKAIIVRDGWPGYNEKINNKTVAMLIHADTDKIKNIKPLLLNEINENSMDSEDFAKIWDRMLLDEGKNQLYGTIYTWNKEKGKQTPPKIENIQKTNEARKKIGLGELKEYKIIN